MERANRIRIGDLIVLAAGATSRASGYLAATNLNWQPGLQAPMKFSLLRWMKNKLRHHPLITEVHAPVLNFLGEQDGPFERDLKERWHQILVRHSAVRRAFLARASYGDTQVHVVLALCTGGIPDLDLVRALRGPFAAKGAEDCPLDMVFVNSSQESQLIQICAPFYEAA